MYIYSIQKAMEELEKKTPINIKDTDTGETITCFTPLDLLEYYTEQFDAYGVELCDSEELNALMRFVSNTLDDVLWLPTLEVEGIVRFFEELEHTGRLPLLLNAIHLWEETVKIKELKKEVEGLEALYELMLDSHPSVCDADGNWKSDLPTFGGADAHAPLVWSWDETRLIQGADIEELRIVDREE